MGYSSHFMDLSTVSGRSLRISSPSSGYHKVILLNRVAKLVSSDPKVEPSLQPGASIARTGSPAAGFPKSCRICSLLLNVCHFVKGELWILHLSCSQVANGTVCLPRILQKKNYLMRAISLGDSTSLIEDAPGPWDLPWAGLHKFCVACLGIPPAGCRAGTRQSWTYPQSKYKTQRANALRHWEAHIDARWENKTSKQDVAPTWASIPTGTCMTCAPPRHLSSGTNCFGPMLLMAGVFQEGHQL